MKLLLIAGLLAAQAMNAQANETKVPAANQEKAPEIVIGDDTIVVPLEPNEDAYVITEKKFTDPLQLKAANMTLEMLESELRMIFQIMEKENQALFFTRISGTDLLFMSPTAKKIIFELNDKEVKALNTLDAHVTKDQKETFSEAIAKLTIKSCGLYLGAPGALNQEVAPISDLLLSFVNTFKNVKNFQEVVKDFKLSSLNGKPVLVFTRSENPLLIEETKPETSEANEVPYASDDEGEPAAKKDSKGS